MTADRRYPWMHPVDGRHLPRVACEDVGRVTRWAARIAGRTGLRPWYNQRSGSVHFCLNDPCVSPYAPRVLDGHGGIRLEDEDLACRSIYRARIPEHKKDAQIESAKRRHDDARRRSVADFQADVRPERKSRAKHELNKIRMGRHSRPVSS